MIRNYIELGKLAVTLVRLQQFQGAVDAARKANNSKTLKEWIEVSLHTLLGAQSRAGSDVIKVAEDTECYNDLVKYLLMVRQKTKEPKVDSELIYGYAKIERPCEMSNFEKMVKFQSTKSDWISALPQAIIEKILTRMPIRDAFEDQYFVQGNGAIRASHSSNSFILEELETGKPNVPTMSGSKQKPPSQAAEGATTDEWSCALCKKRPKREDTDSRGFRLPTKES
ncbi:hypothetical protein L1887_17793 [Cichorium endivia]|nr:hypothetical protein L1887_17793 [Cichorium endivia]